MERHHVLAFDGRAFCRELDSFDRVLRVLTVAAEHAGWGIEIWTDGDLRPDAADFRRWVRPQTAASPSEATVFWSPDISVMPCALPTVATLHDVNPLLPDGRSVLKRWLRRQRFRRRVGRCMDQVDRIITDTCDAQQRVEKAFPSSRDRLSVVPLFVDPHIRPLRGEAGSRILGEWSLAPGYILFVGSLRRHKNWEGLIRAYAALPAALRRDHPLVFAGRARQARPSVERLAGQLGVRDTVHILGVVEADVLHALYGGAGLFACPSFMEGFGFPPLEAMACGVPVVSSDRTCLPEVLGDAAVYIDPASVTSIANGIRSVLDDVNKRDRMIEAGLRQAAAYNPARTALAMGQVLDRLSGGVGPDHPVSCGQPL